MATNPNYIVQASARVPVSVQEEDLDDLEALKRDLLARVDKAREDGRIYLMSQSLRSFRLSQHRRYAHD